MKQYFDGNMTCFDVCIIFQGFGSSWEIEGTLDSLQEEEMPSLMCVLNRLFAPNLTLEQMVGYCESRVSCDCNPIFCLAVYWFPNLFSEHQGRSQTALLI